MRLWILFVLIFFGHGAWAYTCKYPDYFGAESVRELLRHSDNVVLGTPRHREDGWIEVDVETAWKGDVPAVMVFSHYQGFSRRPALIIAHGPRSDGSYARYSCNGIEDSGLALELLRAGHGPGYGPRPDLAWISASWFIGLSVMALVGICGLWWLLSLPPEVRSGA